MPLTTPPPQHVHTQYRAGGRRWPSVTTILGVLDAPALDRWRVKIALTGVDPYRDRSAADTGTMMHAAIAWSLMPDTFPRPDKAGYPESVIEEAQNAFRGFKLWQADHELVPVALEVPLVNAALGYGGTPDAFALVRCLPSCRFHLNDKLRLEVVDWKSSARIYSEYFSQTCAYAQLIAGCTGEVARAVRIVQFNKEGEPGYTEQAIETDGSPCVSRIHFEVFELARLAYAAHAAVERFGAPKPPSNESEAA